MITATNMDPVEERNQRSAGHRAHAGQTPEAAFIAGYIRENFEESSSKPVVVSWLKSVVEFHLESLQLGGRVRREFYVTQAGTLAAFLAEGYRTRTARDGTVSVFAKKRRGAR